MYRTAFKGCNRKGKTTSRRYCRKKAMSMVRTHSHKTCKRPSEVFNADCQNTLQSPLESFIQKEKKKKIFHHIKW